jgi:hypothetical protein
LHRLISTDSLDSTVRSFLPSRAVLVRTGVAVVVFATSAGPVQAQTAESPLAPVRSAWDSGDFDQVPALCQKVLAKGGLGKADALDAYTRLGAALAIAGQKKPAIAAFRRAALIDPAFRLPPEAGKTALALAEAARREQKRAGTLALSFDVTGGERGEVAPGSSFSVDVSLTAPTRGSPVSAITLDATDTLAGKTYEQRAAAGPGAHFEVPSRMTLPDASLLVRVHARDGNDNELAETQRRVRVAPAVPVTESGPIAALTRPAPSRKEERDRAGGGFWNSPWPYVIGGAALAAGGVTTWFLTRPTDNVDVGSVRVQLVH